MPFRPHPRPALLEADLVDYQVCGLPADQAAAAAGDAGLSAGQMMPFRLRVYAPGEGRPDGAGPYCQIAVSVTTPNGQTGEVVFEVQDGQARAMVYPAAGPGGEIEEQPRFAAAPGSEDGVAVLASTPAPAGPGPSPAAEVWVVEAEHWGVPNLRTRTCASEAGARAYALECVNLMRRELGLRPEPDPARLETALAGLKGAARVRGIEGAGDIRAAVFRQEVYP